MAIVDFDPGTWNDPWFHELSHEGKILFIYLWTNPHKTHAGLYQITARTMFNETGIAEERIREVLDELSPKVRYDHDLSIVWVVNHVKRQFLRTGKISPKMVTNIRKNLFALPDSHLFIREFLQVYSTLNIDYPLNPSIYTSPEPLIDTVPEGVDRVSGYPSIGGKGTGKDKGEGGCGGERRDTGPPTKPIDQDRREFEEQLWAPYPPNNGKKLEKEETYRRFCLVPRTDRPLLYKAVRNYAESARVQDGVGIRDPKNFIGNQTNERPYWRDWVEPEKPPPREEDLEAERMSEERAKRERRAETRRLKLLAREAKEGNNSG